MTQEALKLALEALHKGKVACEWGQAHDHVQQIVQAMESIKEALALPQRTWVGLTVEDVHDCLKGLPTQSIEVYARRIEAKLKEKNT